MSTYFTVIAKMDKSSPWAPQFGDYDGETAVEEAQDMKDSGDWYKVKVIKTQDDQAAINQAIADLNSK